MFIFLFFDQSYIFIQCMCNTVIRWHTRTLIFTSKWIFPSKKIILMCLQENLINFSSSELQPLSIYEEPLELKTQFSWIDIKPTYVMPPKFCSRKNKSKNPSPNKNNEQ